MGTDIHLYVEELTEGRWKEIQAPYAERSWCPHYYNAAFGAKEPNPETRNYNVFAFIANVKNGYKAGGYRHDPILPQFPGRGIPEDTSFTEEKYDVHGNYLCGTFLGNHSFTYATLSELLNAPWDMVFHSEGYVDYDKFISINENGYPTAGYCEDIDGVRIEILSLEDFKRKIETGEIDKGNDYTLVSWYWKPLQNCQFRQWIQKLASAHDPNKTRILIGFGS